jgi:hypothetical protein
MKKPLLILLILLIPFYVFCQRPGSARAIPDTSINLKVGIYFTITDFLTNEPSVPYEFKVTNYAPDYYLYPEERSAYYITYTDNMGYHKAMSINEIWGYYDGRDVFLSYHGRPYELLEFGAISILRYQQRYHRNIIAQAFSLYTMGSTVTSFDKVQDVLFHLKNDTIVIPTTKSFQKLISDDRELYTAYKKDKKTDYVIKPLVYLEQYNQKHPVRITSRGIQFEDMPETSQILPE